MEVTKIYFDDPKYRLLKHRTDELLYPKGYCYTLQEKHWFFEWHIPKGAVKFISIEEATKAILRRKLGKIKNKLHGYQKLLRHYKLLHQIDNLEKELKSLEEDKK
jgi:hypothetical protein